MRAIVQDAYGPPSQVLRLASVPDPAPGPGEVLVRMRATSVNTPDWATVTGEPYVLRLGFGLRRPRRPIRGSDVSGVVCSVGPGVTDLSPGDEVVGTTGPRGGAFAELVPVPAAQLVRKPPALAFPDAAASVMTGLTALVALRDAARLQPGASILINGATGGVGTMAVQIAAVLGAEVTAVCSTRNLDLARSLGARHVIDYTTSDFTTAAARYDVVLDNVLNHPPKRVARVLAPGGLLIPNSLGNTGGLLAGLPRTARAALMGLGRTKVRLVSPPPTRENLTALLALLESGDVRVVIDRTYPLEEAPAAVAAMLTHRAAGKIVITT